MIKKSIYPKTERISERGDRIYLTEKMDGSNLVFFKKDGELWFAQRKTIISLSEIDEYRDIMYKGLYQWLKDYGEELKHNLNEGSAIAGEWIGMSITKYPTDIFDKKWYMFAKANIDDDFNLYNLIYNQDLFVYSFINQSIPSYIGTVPVVATIGVLPDKALLDKIYKEYVDKEQRDVEGFVINYNNNITKYVRRKNGKLVEYSETAHKGDSE